MSLKKKEEGRRKSERDSKHEKDSTAIAGLKMEGARWKAGEENEFGQQPVSLEEVPGSQVRTAAPADTLALAW